ncbi:transcriptional regulator with XRE-family HTH domain [Mesonia hippocampi]|uniref:Transcriptional regulator with XRE-family HTH domain n=1 Tax=Mesonia hippocampi TaxID=1628250 RepID=A0A840ESL1_9FLAO|nr:hypothetical protein [Mesonia hippocampi]MBB4120011.1 transcriptional regulator with XRE-family HTH domain [Mesonia hippocampi]
MENVKLKKLLATIGKTIKQHRLQQELQPEDIAEMTNLTAVTIRNIEAGEETYLSNFLAVCLALKMAPKDILDIEIKLEPLYKLSQPRKEKSRLTPRINKILGSDFFTQERTAKDVVRELGAIYKISPSTAEVSVILKRKVKEGKLNIEKQGRLNIYKK